MPKVLIIRFSSIGDIVLTTPVIRCLKKQLPNCELHYVTKKSFYGLLRYNPYLDKIHVLDDSLDALINQLRQERFDYIIDLHNNLRSFWIRWNLDATSYTFKKLNIRKWLTVNLKWNVMPKKHVVDRYLQTCAPLRITNDGRGLDYFIHQSEQVPLQDLPLSHLHGYVALVLGATYYTKRIPLQKAQEICAGLKCPIILIGGREEKGMGDELAREFPLSVYNACGLYSINQSASLIERAKHVITADTGMMHIAAACQKDISILWGNTIPAFGMGVYYPKDAKARATDFGVSLSCRPCSKLGHHDCPKKHFNCMMQQDVNRLIHHILPNQRTY
ncbi:MAG: glycosyltransferase family 9 protein [Bacteroidota bacterium]|jgi:ADP-heptose:LPS heptosyltransferase